ncbi:hypothetical protein HPP92_008682 [Vanilla planifolia]|uniref:Leucine-rich repeat-containing N-terminal plant-type domain-containing protein n=1 Tax=Vanilla planifolia TaxID=51239 RepID=A0A835R6I9_VANPL|nr:hypothetical protein HPP92_008682 [Vanilla planifolia]
MEFPKTLRRLIFHGIFIVTIALLSCSSSLCQSSLATATTNSTDRLALLSFKATLSNSSEALAFWKVALPFCQWTGVTCNGGRVTRLALVSLGLTGPISPSLGNLTFLESLNLQDNNLLGPIPSELGLLSHLVNLTLKLNYLTGPIPGV